MVQVNIPNLGIVNFPDDMAEADINREAQSLYDQHNRPQERTFGERITDALGTISPALARGSIQTGLGARATANALGLVSNEDLAQEAGRAAVRTQQYEAPENIRAGQAAIQRAGEIGAYEGAQAMMANPSAVFSSLVESIPAMAIMAGTGGATGILGRAALGQLAGRIGMMLGTGGSSYGMEFGQTVLQHIAESGVDIKNPQQLQQVLNDPLRMTEAINAAMRRATAVAAFDTASAGLAGRTIRPGQGLAQTLRGVGRETLEQAGLGTTGEVAGQLAQHGRIQNYSDILMEGLGEVALGGPMEIAAGALSTRPRAQPPAPTEEAPPAQEAPAEERAVTDPQLAREMLAERGVDHGTFSDEVAVAAANRLVQRVADEIPDIEARTQQYEQEVQALTGSTFDAEGKRRWNNAEYGRLQTRLDTLEREREHIADPKKLEKNQREIEKTQARLNTLVNSLDARFADIHQRPFEQKPSQTGISDLDRRQSDERPIIVDRQGQAYPESPLLHQQGRGAEPGLVRTGNAPPRMMVPVEVDTADRFGLRNLWASTDPEQAADNAKMVGEVYGALAKKFDIPERAVGLGGELNLYNVRPSPAAYGDYSPGSKSIRSPADLTSTMVHEWVHALDNALGERAGTTWASLAKMPGELGDAWRQLVNNIVANSPTFLNNSRRMGSAYWTDPREMLSRAIEASWADWFKGTDFAKDFNNKLRRMNIQPYPRGGELTRIKGALENFIRKLTVVPKKDPRMGHVFEPLVPGGTRNVEPTPGGPLLSAAYHGTGHSGFDRFSLEHVGTGEGAQAFGWGLYFAEKKDIAKYYKDKLAERRYAPVKVKINNLTDLQTNAISDLNRITTRSGATKEAIIKSAQEILAKVIHTDQEEAALQREIIRLLKSGDVEVSSQRGALYKVELAPAEHEYLDLDKPLSEQSNTVKEALKKIPEKLWDSLNYELDARGYTEIEHDSDIYTGHELYKILTRYAQEDALPGVDTDGTVPKKDVSLYLKSLGIRGNKYFDATSRGGQDGSRNYVIFDDKDVVITERLESGNGRLNARAEAADRGMTQAVPAAALRAQARKMERAEIESTLKPEGTAEVPTREPPEKVTLMTPEQMEDFLKGRGTPAQRLGAFSGFWHTPLYLADKFPEFRPWMNALLSFARTRAAKMHSYLDTALPLTNASKQVVREVTRMAEAANSMGTMPTQNPDGSYTLTVGPLATKAYQTGHLNAPVVGSKPGDVITLRGEAAQAFTSLRKSLDTAYQDLIDSTLAKLGYAPGTTPKDIRAQARSLEGAAKRRMETAADVVEELLTKRKVAYIPQMRSGKARVIIMKPEIKNGKMEVGEDGFPRTPIDSEAAADRTWSIPFDAYTRSGALKKANAYMARVRAKFPAKDGWVMFTREMNQDALRDSITPSERGIDLVQNLANLFLTEQPPLRDKDGKPVDPLDDFLDKLGELKKRMGERGFKASLARRRDLPGWLREENYDTYLPSAVGAYLVRAANFIARNYHTREMQDAKAGLQNQRRHDLLTYIKQQEEDMASPQAFTNFVKSMAFNWFLGWRLSSAAVNLTQLPQTAFPYVSMAAGTRRGAMELLKSFKDINRLMLPSAHRLFKGYTEENIIDWNTRPSYISEKHWNILRELRNEGTLSAVVTHEQSGRVASVVDDQYLMSGLRKEFGPKVHAVMRTMPFFFTSVEQINRMSTALAVLRLTDDPKMAEKFKKLTRGTLNEAQELSQKELTRIAVDRTQLLISDINRPTMMRGTLGGIATQFMQYPIGVMEFWATILRNTGLTSKETARFLAPAVVGLLLTSGLWGVPGGQDANDLIRELSRRIAPLFGGQGVDIHRAIQHYLQNVLKELGLDERTAYGIPEAIFKGLPRLAGVDLSRRAAANFNVSEMLFAADPTRVLGPGGAMVINSIQDAHGYLSHGHPYLAMTALLPAFARDMTHAIEGLQGRGPISPATGNSRLPAGEELRGRAGLLAMGFNPTSIARSQEETANLRYRPMQAQIQYWNERLSDALADQMAAARRGNEERAARSRQEFQSILREMREADQGRPPHERVLRPNTLQNVRQQALAKVRGPVEAAVRRLPQAERVEAQRNLDATYPRSIR